MLKRTPLYAAHVKLGAKLVDFGGWEMPVQYTSITEEHQAVRQAVGIFDISHMGEVTVSGQGAEAFLNQALTNDVRKLAPGQGQYSLMCNELGGVIDDLYVYRMAPNAFFLIINAARIGDDVAWLKARAAVYKDDAVNLTDASHHYAAIAVQGPKARALVSQIIPGAADGMRVAAGVAELKKNQIARFAFQKTDVLVACTGYTGEDGFEILGPENIAVPLWDALLAAGAGFGLKPCGLGARDTLRTEMCYPLYGHELDEQTTPVEAGVGFFVSLDKGPFSGSTVLTEQKEAGVAKKLVAFKMTEKSAPPRPHYPIWVDGASCGVVTSGTQSPTLGLGIGMGYVPKAHSAPGTTIGIEVRGKRYPAVVVPKPFYRPAKV